MASTRIQAEPKILKLDPHLEAAFETLTEEEQRELMKAAATLLDAIPIDQDCSSLTCIWADVSFGRVGVAIYLGEVLVTCDTVPRAPSPDDRPPGKVFKVELCSHLKATFGTLTEEEQRELMKAAATLLDAIPINQDCSGLTCTWADVSFGRVRRGDLPRGNPSHV